MRPENSKRYKLNSYKEPAMTAETIQGYALSKGFHPQIKERWLSWNANDGAALLETAVSLKAGENHLRDLMDWLEEIALRDGIAIGEVLQSKTISNIRTDPRLGRADRLKRIKDQIRRIRFPRLSQIEDSIQSRIRQLKLPSAVKVSVPAGLEGGDLQIEFTAGSPAEFKSILAKLGAAAESESLAEIYVLLNSAANAEPSAELGASSAC
jgi:hypothetical protein